MPTYQNALTQQPANRLAYQDRIGATPRNEYLGALADFLAQSYAPQRAQQMQGVAQFLQVPAVSQTLDRLSYGEPLTTGAGGLGGTTRVRPEALEAAMAVAPLAQPATMASLQAARVARQAALATKGMPVGMSTEAVGGMGFLRPQAPQEEALRLAQQRAALPPSQGGLGLPANNTAQQRAAAMEFNQPMFHETEGANIDRGLLNFDVRRVGAAASDEQTPYAMFLKPHPVGINIARNNPAQMPVLVKTNLSDQNILQGFQNRDELQQYLNQFPEIKKSTQAVRDLDRQMANYISEIEKKADALEAQGKRQEADKLLDSLNFDSKLMKEFDARNNELAAIAKEKITDLFKSKGIGTVALTDDAGALGRSTITEMVLNPADNVRSRFAAFDPWRKTAATAAAFGVAAPDLMAAEKAQQDAYSQNEMRKFMRQGRR